ncbi:hypothetical protein NKR23_g66 [Pleurostoma richardsiae]|uniref:ABM domain-containing protein n=1 Tax=Pleurostoma richardsiae TaxID=41990 RepID=A0AA38S724_9PEZI|nr:hypothetical protein NKR23_g66 [Pleurostoma richardsiae]
MTVTEFCIMQLKPDATIEEAGSQASETWSKMTTLLKQAPGCLKVFYGRKIEDSSVGVLCVTWRSYADVQAWSTSPARESFLVGLDALADLASAHHLNADATVALSAPATEVFTGYGAQPGFAGNVAQFAEKLDAEKPTGYYGLAHGEVLEEISKEEGGEKGKAAKLVIGWESREAHFEAKGKPGAIANNIGLLRVLQKSADLYHVNFKQQ